MPDLQGLSMKFKVMVDNWATLQSDAGLARRQVFVIEQKIPEELEWDDMGLYACMQSHTTKPNKH